MLERFVSVVGGATLPFLLYAALAVLLTPAVVEGWPRSSRWRLGSALAGTTAALVVVILRETTILTRRTSVNIPTLIACVIADLALIVVLTLLVRRRTWGAEGRLGAVAQASACLAIALAFFRAIPEVVLQLTAFIEPGEATFSSEMLLRVLGFVGGWVAVALLAFLYYRAARRAPVRLTRVTLLGFIIVFTAIHAVQLVRILQSTHVIRLDSAAFHLMAWTTNNAGGIVLLTAAAIWLVPMAAALLRVIGRAPAQANPARTRALRAERRRSRRWVIASAAGFALLVVTRTVAVAKVNEVPTLSDPEPYETADDAVVIPAATLADGHLHRFEYTASDGTAVRFIVILKNGGAYGVGLDACEACGPSGYYEADGKVICKRCDVAINIATIGFKGGCNPIPIDFTVSDGAVTVANSVLEESAEVFA
ncbi:DUF2318 domain-containing protein [Actinomyces sp. MRS3W]|uniref:DUF2318 domain-containing protein n=1 Tax=Actinomyces sp. MRS3W TaxID=2800796 RepID=UPI0028FD1A63|nr:DUF2318 domain-containing protein [Actinomyces sp. MRS3W]MDU0347738.1 DUF2318 domain-containing protein [Actinomyces sp. MRS3W]